MPCKSTSGHCFPLGFFKINKWNGMSVSNISSITLKCNFSPATSVINLPCTCPRTARSTPRQLLSAQTPTGGPPEAPPSPRPPSIFQTPENSYVSVFTVIKMVRVGQKIQMEPSCQPLGPARLCHQRGMRFLSQGSSCLRTWSRRGHPGTGSREVAVGPPVRRSCCPQPPGRGPAVTRS